MAKFLIKDCFQQKKNERKKGFIQVLKNNLQNAFYKGTETFFLLMFWNEEEEKENLRHIWCFPLTEQTKKMSIQSFSATTNGQRGRKDSILMVSGIKAWWNKLKTTIMTSFSIYSVLSRLHLSSSVSSHHSHPQLFHNE